LVPSAGRRGLRGLRAIAAAAASSRGREQGEGLASSSGMLDYAVSSPVIAVGAAAIVFLIFGFPQCRVRRHDASPPPEASAVSPFGSLWPDGLTFGVLLDDAP
jgi:hypothetical protein